VNDDPNHAVLAAPWKYRTVALSFQCNGDQLNAELDLTLRNEETTVRLRFYGVHGLEIDDCFPWGGSGMQILDTSARGMETARVRVCSSEPDPAIRFWARSVKRICPEENIELDHSES
jgi:hypothetical protein